MLKSVIIGFLLSITAFIVGFVTRDWMLALKIIGGAALIPLLLVGVFSGAMAQDEHHVRTIYHSETKKTRQERSQMIIFFFGLSLPNLIILVIMIAIGLTR